MFVELECPICGKVFIRQTGSIYKVRLNGHVKQMCGCTCYIKAKELHESEKHIGEKL